jgi:hypothetical protein
MSSRARVFILEAVMSLVARMGIIWDLWRPSALHFRLNVPPLGLNVILEGHDITLGDVFRC